jgi:NADPH:quinone reductase-like Zn-dependent oxidoreductase
VIAALGPAVSGWQVGDEVIGISASGSYADYSLASATAIARNPRAWSFVEAAGIGVVGETAWRAVVTVADVQPGQRVLIHGGAGGVGSAAVQVARARGAHVIATASPRNHEFLRGLGADELIDYNTTRFEDQVRDADMVLNTVDADTGLRSIGVLKRGGILVSVVGETPADRCASAGIRCAITGRVNGEMLARVVELADAGKFRISVERVMALPDVAAAWEASRAGHTRGKIVLEVSD